VSAPEPTVETPPRAGRSEPAVGAARVAEISQTILTGLMLAFIFRAFLVEPFIIPTGSMADTLVGRHATCTCPVCGWEYKYAPLRSPSPAGGEFVCPSDSTCPNCQTRFDVRPADVTPQAGDRILVHKWPYALGGPFAPQRWDVVVFRDPADYTQHYVKRLIGLPGETVEIIDGDVYIDDRIARKPPAVQRSMWFVVFDQSHLPDAESATGERPRWAPTEPPDDGPSGWSGTLTRVLRYDGLDGRLRRLRFNSDAAPDYLLDFYAFNRRSSGVFVGDVRVRADLTIHDGPGVCRLEYVRPPYRFTLDLVRDGRVQLEMQNLESDDAPRIVGTARRHALEFDRPYAVELAHVDYRVYAAIDGQEVVTTSDAEYRPDLVRLRRDLGQRPARLYLTARDVRLELRGLRVDRDVQYTTQPGRTQRAHPDHPFLLQAGEYFVLGDNSPDSHDSREWTAAGPHLPAGSRPGTLRADQIVGEAAFVYLPGLLPLGTGGRWSVPDLGRVRFVR
jgi:signal peptidase I